MKVEELIEELQKCNPEDTVYVQSYGDECGFEYEPETIGGLARWSGTKDGIILRL